MQSQKTGREIPAMETLHISGKFSEKLFKNRHHFKLVCIEISFFGEAFLRLETLPLQINARVF